MTFHFTGSVQARFVASARALAFLALLTVPAAVRLHAAPVTCESLAQLKLEDTVIAEAKSVSAGPLTIQGFGPPTTVNLPAYCRVTGSIHPTADSDIAFEVWLPVDWNGRFQAVGNGGLAGSIGTSEMADALRAGYATAGTDTGHTGTPITGDWALGHPEKIIDFGYRAVHLMTVQAKAVITAFYGSPAQYSYWNGCSEGGGQALSEAQRFPADYNGILAGAPANYFVHLQAGGNWISQAIHKDPATFLPPEKLPAITAAVLAQCDAADGVKDGILEDPRTCKFDPAVLECKGADSSTCLTRPQMEGLRKIFEGAKNPRTGQQVFPGTMPGGENGWGLWIAGTAVPPRDLQHLIMMGFFPYFVFNNPAWDWTTFDFDTDVTLADQKVGVILNQINPDLSAFKKDGGRLLQYHGWNDPAISPLNSVNYFESVQAKMGDTAGFYRLFMMPGVEHCGGGPGPSQFDKMAVIVDWVEHGKAPDSIVVSGHGRTRPLCPYPQIAKYKGTGSTDSAENFACAEPAH
jgi:Tannase and feruloyl esterase